MQKVVCLFVLKVFQHCYIMFPETFIVVQIYRKFVIVFFGFCFVMEHKIMFHETFVAVQICRKLVKKIRQV